MYRGDYQKRVREVIEESESLSLGVKADRDILINKLNSLNSQTKEHEPDNVNYSRGDNEMSAAKQLAASSIDNIEQLLRDMLVGDYADNEVSLGVLQDGKEEIEPPPPHY